MFGRIVFVEGADHQVEEAIQGFHDRIAPAAIARPGFAGVALLLDRASARAATVTYFQDRASLEASADSARQLREGISQQFGYRIAAVKEYEIVFAERAAATAAGNYTRVVRAEGADAARLQAGVELVRSRMAPVWRGQKGFVGGLVGINNEAGEALVSSIWASRADLDASEAAIASVRTEISEASQPSRPEPEPEIYEVVAVEGVRG